LNFWKIIFTTEPTWVLVNPRLRKRQSPLFMSCFFFLFLFPPFGVHACSGREEGNEDTCVCSVAPRPSWQIEFPAYNQTAWATYPRGQVEPTATMKDENWMDRKHFSIQFWFLSLPQWLAYLPTFLPISPLLRF